MAPYAYKYNDIYDDYVIQPTRRNNTNAYGNTAPRANAAPKRAPSYERVAQPSKKPELKRVDGTKKKGILKANKTFRNFLIQMSIVVALCLSALVPIAVSYAQVEAAEQKLEQLEADYAACLELNNQLKFQLDESMKGVNIPKIAETQLGLVKIPDNRRGKIVLDDYRNNSVE